MLSALYIAEKIEEKDKVSQKKISRILTDFASKQKNEVFLTKLTGYSQSDREAQTAIPSAYTTSTKNKSVQFYTFKEDRVIFIKNLLFLKDFYGKPIDSVNAIMSPDFKTLEKKFNERCNELKYRRDLYDFFANNSVTLKKLLCDDGFDFVKQDISKALTNTSTPLNNTAERLMKINFSGLSQLEEIEELEEEDVLSESQLMAKKAILYMDMENKELALQCADNALNIDNKNGIAWMVKGLILIHGRESMFGFRNQMENTHDSDIATLLLNAWEFLPNTLKEMRPYNGYTSAPVYPYHPIYNEKYLIRSFILHAKELNAYLFNNKNTEKEKFLDLLTRDFDKRSFTDEVLTPYYFMKLLPLIHEVDPKVERCFAKKWVDSILSVSSTSDLLNDKKINVGIDELSKDRTFLAELSSTLSFDEIAKLSNHMSSLFIEFERQRHFEYLNDLYWKELFKVGGNVSDQLQVCDSALKFLPFKETNIDQSTLKQWSYLKLRLIAEQAFEYLSDEDWNSLAAFLVEHIDPSLLEYAAKLDFNDISWPRSSRKQEEIWFTALHKGVEANKKVAFDAFYAVECFKGRDAERIQKYPLLSDLLNEVLKNITEKSEHTTKLHELEKACNQFF